MAISVSSHASRFSAEEWATRIDLAACFRLVAHFGMDELVWNHISARIPGTDDQYLINDLGIHRYDEITASNLVKVDAEGRVIGDTAKSTLPSFIIHGAIHQARPEMQCVLHTHSDGGLAVSALEEGLVPMTQDAFLFYDQIRYHEYEGLSTDPSEQQRLVESIGDGFALIMRNHGLLTVGETIGEAFVLMYYLERACRIQMQVMATGRKVRMPSKQIRSRAYSQFREYCWPGKYEWPALKRLADSLDPSYRN